MIKVCHITSAHNSSDIRIFHKECVSLVKDGYETYLVAPGETREENGVHVIGLGEKPASRRNRMTRYAQNAYKQAMKVQANIYHFHDPEFLPYGLRLKRRGAKVIFDSHEDVSAQIEDKDWIPLPLRRLISKLYFVYETYAVKKIDTVVAATPYIAEQFRHRANKVITVNNYPKLDDIVFQDKPFAEREAIVCYAGGICEMRGEKIMVEAMKGIDGKLILAGDSDKTQISGGVIEYVGRLDRNGVNELYRRSFVGLCVLKPAKNYINSQPIKIFEYMAAGLPVVASDFPLWKEIVENNHCGLCVDPISAENVRSAVIQILHNSDMAQEMGLNGRRVVETEYNWGTQEDKLLALYEELSK